MDNITTVGIDLAKNIFQCHGVDKNGHQLFSKRLTRTKLVTFIAKLSPCTIAMEACGGSNYWGRKFRSYGHDVKLIAPQFVKPFVKSNKNDARDAEAICEAATRPSMRFVPIKEIEHQDMKMLHRMRSQIVKQRTALSNQIRGFLAEYGVILPKGLTYVRKRLANIIEDNHNELSSKARALFNELLADFHQLDSRVKSYDDKVTQEVSQNEVCKRLMKVEGIGPLTATAFWATITQPELFKNGRGVSAMLGLVPKQRSSGNRTLLLGISKRGDRYLRTLLIHGGRTVVKSSASSHSPTAKQRWVNDKANHCGVNKTAVAIGNKNARILWALLHNKEDYRANV